jgi:hypothetical protein
MGYAYAGEVLSCSTRCCAFPSHALALYSRLFGHGSHVTQKLLAQNLREGPTNF